MNAQKETIIKIKSVYKNNFIKGADTLVPRAPAHQITYHAFIMLFHHAEVAY